MGWKWLTQAMVVSHDPCRLKGLVVTPSAAAAECTVYNGEGTDDPVALSIVLNAQDSFPFDFPEGIELDRGLYVGSFTNITGVLVLWEPRGQG